MLDERVKHLAEKTWGTLVTKSRGEYVTALRRTQELLASKGIVGGNGVGALACLGAEQISNETAAASESLIEACKSVGVRYYSELRTDLGKAFSELLAHDFGPVKADLVHALLPHARDNAERIFENDLLPARVSARQKAEVSLDHFVAQLQRESREKRNSWVERIVLLLVGALIARLPDQFAALAKLGSAFRR